MGGPLYVETSAALRAVLESCTTPELERRIEEADALVTSRLSLVETARAMHRARSTSRLKPELELVSADERLLRAAGVR